MSLRTPGYWEREEEGIGKVIRKNVTLLAVALAILLIVGFIFIYSGIPKGSAPPLSGGKISLSNSQVLSICAKQPITTDFITRNPAYQTEVTFLDKTTLQELAATSPAIYADLPQENGLYKVRYLGEEEGIMLILDPKNKEILKYYRVRTLTFP